MTLLVEARSSGPGPSIAYGTQPDGPYREGSLWVAGLVAKCTRLVAEDRKSDGVTIVIRYSKGD